MKSQNSKIESVQINWDEIQRYDSSSLSTEKTHYVTVFGKFNRINNSSWNIQIETHENEVDMQSMILIDNLRVGVEYFD